MLLKFQIKFLTAVTFLLGVFSKAEVHATAMSTLMTTPTFSAGSDVTLNSDIFGVAMSSAGNFFTLQDADDGATKVLKRYGPSGTFPSGAGISLSSDCSAIYARSYVYVINGSNLQARKLTDLTVDTAALNSGEIAGVHNPGSGDSALSIFADSSNKVYVLKSSGMLEKYDSDGSFVTAYNVNSSGSPISISGDDSSYIYVVYDDGIVYRYSSATGTVDGSFLIQVDGAKNIFVDSTGIYLSIDDPATRPDTDEELIDTGVGVKGAAKFDSSGNPIFRFDVQYRMSDTGFSFGRVKPFHRTAGGVSTLYLFDDGNGVMKAYAMTPKPVTSPSASATGTTINLSWTKPLDVDYSGVTIRRSTTTYPASPSAGSAVVTDNTGTSTSQNSLSEDSYYYSFFTKNSEGIYSTVATAMATVDTTPPSAPTLSASKPVVNGTTINLSWDVPSSTNTFTLKRTKDGGGETTVQAGIAVSTTTYSNTGLTDGLYVYNIYAVDSAGNVSNAGTSSSVVIDATAPSAPTLNASKLSSNGTTINLSWDAPSGTDTFNLKLIYNGGSEVAVDTLISSSVTSATKTSLADGTYVYKIYAVDAYGNISSAGAASSLTIDSTAPSAPSGFAAITTDSDIALSWTNPVSDFASVTIRKSTTAYPTSTIDGSAVLSNSIATSYSDASLADGVYYYSIFALDSLGNISSAAHATATVSTAVVELAVAVTPPPHLENVRVNDNITFSLSISNSGGADSDDTELTFNLSSNLQFVSAELVSSFSASFGSSLRSASSVSCTGTTSITCNIGTVASGDTASLSVTTKVTAAGSLSFSVSGDGISGDSATSTGTISAGSSGGCSLDLHSEKQSPLAGIFFFASTAIAYFFLRRRPQYG